MYLSKPGSTTTVKGFKNRKKGGHISIAGACEIQGVKRLRQASVLESTGSLDLERFTSIHLRMTCLKFLLGLNRRKHALPMILVTQEVRWLFAKTVFAPCLETTVTELAKPTLYSLETSFFLVFYSSIQVVRFKHFSWAL